MRILHTSDWHVGKRLGRHDRLADHRAVLDEIIDVAEREAVDLVLVAGDLFERPTPGIDALRLVLDALIRLAAPGRPVVAIAGNHDSPALFELLAPLLEPLGIYLVGAIRAPAEGGVLTLDAGGERALVACFPFMRAGLAVDFMRDVEGWHRAYAERLGLLTCAYCDHLETHGAAAVKLLMGHFPIHGVRLGTGGGDETGPRGERMLHLGESYSARPEAIPPGPSYVALGHIHTPQEAPGARVAARYAGSPLELDFGEAGEAKEVVLIDIAPGGVARCRARRITAGRRLIRARGRFEALAARPELAEAYLDLVVETDGPDPGLADRARAAFPHLVKVRAEYPREHRERPVRADTSWDQLYLDYYRKLYQTEPDPDLLAAFREVLGEVLGDASGDA